MNNFFLVVVFIVVPVFAYTQKQDSSMNMRIIKMQDIMSTPDKKTLVFGSDTGQYDRINITGYIQTLYENYQQDLVELYDARNTFYIRRARIRFMYQTRQGIRFILQPDFSKGELTMKDAYAEISFPKLGNISLLAGKFRRPNYQFEYGSSEKEILERARVIKNIYPDQRDIGIKLLYNGIALPLKLQFALMNGNFDETQTKDVDSRKDIMALVSYSLSIPNSGTSIDFGTNFYYGGFRAKSTEYVSGFNGIIDSLKLGDYLKRKWFSLTAQVYSDFLGGMVIKGELLNGRNVYDVNPEAPASKSNPYKVKDFLGYYLYFVKKIGTKNQFIARYDFFDPNTKLAGDAAGGDVWYRTVAFALEHFLNDNIDLGISYELPKNEVSNESISDFKDNIFKARVQVKF
jgi:hypothetical protein